MNNKCCFFYFLIGLSIILLVISICLNISKCTITNESIVVTFIGILATFVVISNYAQVVDVKNSFNEKAQFLEEKISFVEMLLKEDDLYKITKILIKKMVNKESIDCIVTAKKDSVKNEKLLVKINSDNYFIFENDKKISITPLLIVSDNKNYSFSPQEKEKIKKIYEQIMKLKT